LEIIEVEGRFGPSKYSMYMLAVDEMLIKAKESGDEKWLLSEFKNNVIELNHVPHLKPDISKFTDSQLIRIIKALNDYQNAMDLICNVCTDKYGAEFRSAMNRRGNEEAEEDEDSPILNEFDKLIHTANNEINKKYNLDLCHSGHEIYINELYEE
jgi:hypothetical protein